MPKNWLQISRTSNYDPSTIKAALDAFVNVAYPADVAGIQSQIDGKITTWFQSDDPNTWATEDRPQHDGDLWYNSSTKRLYRYFASTNTWDEIKDQDALDAISDAAAAQDTADGKRRVFVAEPTTPYDVGDLWTAGPTGQLKKCKTAKAAGAAYDAADWELASNADNTQTTIDGGIITTGTVEVQQGGTTAAGMTGNDSGDTATRFWAGASKENRNTAPWTADQAGKHTWRATVGGKALVTTMGPTGGLTFTYDGAVVGKFDVINGKGRLLLSMLADPNALTDGYLSLEDDPTYGSYQALRFFTKDGAGGFIEPLRVSHYSFGSYLERLPAVSNKGWLYLKASGKSGYLPFSMLRLSGGDSGGSAVLSGSDGAASENSNSFSTTPTEAKLNRVINGTPYEFPFPLTDHGEGTSSSTGGADTVVSFNRTFPSIPNVCANSMNGSYTCRIKSRSTTGFTLVISGASVTFNWIALL